ncbi:BID domain-containing protein [Agrobacterium tumefaciens]|uniref:Fic family protein n=1 Tax=Agrobacterium tumefaciens TaxID=358 RepID=UPI0015733393|nr:BID domain-containing protein [Agrobacterium tumefaciens]
MTFDPFGDYATRGYLRNVRGADETAVKRLEHAAFRGELDFALDYLKSRTELSYEDVLQTHAKLFSGLYPWAGQDRTVTAPGSAIGKNGNFDLFSHPADSRRAVETALEMAADRSTMRTKPGEIMGYLAYAHPFLDGNGRTIMTVHAELCRRAGIHIDWSQTNKTDYLNALTKELDAPGKGHLDLYLKPFVRIETLGQTQAANMLRRLPGLGPSTDPQQGPVIVPKREMNPVLTKAEINTALAANSTFVGSNTKFEKIAAVVYKDPSPIIKDIRHAALTGIIGDRSVLRRIELDPNSYGSYKGSTGIFSGQQERNAHRDAVVARAGLIGAAEQLISVAHGIRQAAASEKLQLTERGRIEVRLPDAALMDAIEKKRPLSDAQAAEIDKAIRSFKHRFGDDLGKLRTARNLEPLASKHGLDAQQISMAREVLKTLDKGQSQTREQAQAIKQSQGQVRGGPTR